MSGKLEELKEMYRVIAIRELLTRKSMSIRGSKLMSRGKERV